MPPVFRYAACGTEPGSYGECPACATVVPDEDVLILPGPGSGLDPDPDPADPLSRALLAPSRLLPAVAVDQV